MSLRQSAKYKAFLWILTIVCIGGSGFLAYKTFFSSTSAAKELTAAEDAYGRGLAAYEQKNWAGAATEFDKAKLISQKALSKEGIASLGGEIKSGKVTEEEAGRMIANFNWVKARAIRDQAFAKAQVDGKPIPEAPDPQYNETFRAFILIPEPEARGEAIAALREATSRMVADSQTPKDVYKDVLKESLRVELVLTPIPWKIAEPLLNKSLDVNPNDARSHYYLARFEYDQPVDDNGTPTDVRKKASERIDRARDHLAAAKKNGAPYWRTAGLEAEILDWPVRTAVVRKLKPDAVAAAETALDGFLFASQDGAIENVTRGEKLTGLNRADGLGLADVLLVGIERAVIESKQPGGTPERVRAVARAAIELGEKLAAEPAAKGILPEVLTAVVQVAYSAQQVLVKAEPIGWRAYAARLDKLLTTTADIMKMQPRMEIYVSQIDTVDAIQALRANDVATAKELNSRARKALESGLKACEDAKLPAIEIDNFHAMLADQMLRMGAKPEEVEPHLAHLRASTTLAAKQVGQLLEGLVAEYQGKMDKARKILQPLASERNSPDRDVRDRAFRANVLMFVASHAMGDEISALDALGEVESKYTTDQVSLVARDFADQKIGGADGITVHRIVGNLAVALQAVAQFLKDNPGKTTIPGELISGSETTATTLLKKLRPATLANQKARIALVGFYLKTNRRSLAETKLAELATDYPDSVEVLRARCVLLAFPPDSASGQRDANGVAAADAIIRTFLKSYPGDRAARLFNAEWLLMTGRASAAVDFLKDPANFPGGRDAVVDRALASALMQSGQRGEAQKILSGLPPDPAIDAVLIQAAVNREASEKQLKDALARHSDDPGMVRVYEAALRLTEGKYEEAIQGFASAVEFSKIGATAKVGLQRALVAYAEAEPAKARDTTVKMAVEMPDFPGVYLAAVDAALILDDIGEPGDKWEQTKTAWAALNRWEAASQKAGTSRAEISLIRTQFQLMAGNPDAAKREAANGLTRDPKFVPLMFALADLALMAPADTARAREMYDTVVKENPADPRLPYLDARIKAIAGDWTGAAAVYERMVDETPRNGAPYALLVAALEGGEKKDAALIWARKWQTKLPDDAQAALTVIRLLAPANKPEATKAATEFVTRQVADARKRMAETSPPIPPAEADKNADKMRGNALFATASAFFRAKVIDEADARGREAGKYLPGDERISLLLGDIAILRKDWDAALGLYGALLKQNPRHFIAGNNLAWILAEKKNDPAAALVVVEDVRKGRNGVRDIGAERLPPDFLDTIGVVYVKLNQSAKFAEMKALFEVAARRYPNDPRMYLYLGQALAGTGEKSKALETLDVATRLAGVKNALPDEQNKSVIDAAEAARKRIRG